MIEGKRYRVRYRLATQRYDREMVAQYLGAHDRSWNSARVEHLFNLRPLAGTTTLLETDIVGSPVETDEPLCIQRRARG